MTDNRPSLLPEHILGIPTFVILFLPFCAGLLLFAFAMFGSLDISIAERNNEDIQVIEKMKKQVVLYARIGGLLIGWPFFITIATMIYWFWKLGVLFKNG